MDQIARPKYERKRLGYSSDLNRRRLGNDRATVAPAEPPGTAAEDGNAQCRQCIALYGANRLPVAAVAARGFHPMPPCSIYFYAWRDDGVLERINFELLLQAREAAGREPSPLAGVYRYGQDHQAGGPGGFDVAKKIKGGKRACGH